MKRSIIHCLALILCCSVVLSVHAQKRKPGMWKVYLYNRVTKKIKSDCTAIMGKNDYKPRYECRADKKEKSVAFDLGPDWKPVPLSPVCMRNRVTGILKGDYLKYESGKGGNVKYLDVNKETEEYTVLDEQWEPVPLDDPQCEPLTFPKIVDPPKHFEFDIISDLEEPAEEEDAE